jgi:membrane fusion protein (multidrug efflux system)
MVSPGQHVRVGDELFRIADFDPLIAKLYLPEKDVLSLSVGRGVRLTLAADSSVQFTGTIRQISPVVDTATGTVKVTVEANEPPSDVRPGAFVSVAIVREQRSAAVLLPRESVLREVRSAHVFIAGDNDTAVRRPVTLGLEENGKVEALSGVQPGERVIVAGQGGLKEGTKIKVL